MTGKHPPVTSLEKQQVSAHHPDPGRTPATPRTAGSADAAGPAAPWDQGRQAISEDRNPLHLSDEAGQNSIFGRRVAHGMLSASLFSALLGEKLPGHGAIYLSQSLQFIAPVYPGDKVDASVTVEKINPSKKHVTLKCEALVSGKLVIKGQAIALAPSRS